MPVLEHDLFLLMINLSQLRTPEQVLRIFLDATRTLVPGVSFRSLRPDDTSDGEIIDVATASHHFGRVALEGDLDSLDRDQRSLLRNAVRMLAIVLEKTEYSRIVQEERQDLQKHLRTKTDLLSRQEQELQRLSTEREDVAKRLGLTEAYYQALFEAVGMGVVVQDLDGKIVIANDHAGEILRFPSGELQNRNSHDPVWKMVLEDGVTPVPGENHPSMLTLRTLEPICNAVRGLYADDSENMIWLTINTNPIFTPGTRDVIGVLSTFEDITELKKTQKALEESEERLRGIFNNAAIGIFRAGPKRFSAINPAFAKMLGYESSEEALQEITDIGTDVYVHPSHRKAILEEIHRRGGEIHHFEVMFQRRDGSTFLADVSVKGRLDEHGDVIAMEGFVEDTTERREAQEALFESELKYRRYISSSPIAVFIVDEQGRYLEVNPAACSMTGYSMEELLEKRVPDLLDKEYALEGIKHFQRVQETGKAIGDFLFTKKNGERFWMTVHAVRLSSTRFLGFGEDITERMENERVTHEAKERYRLLVENAPLGILSIGRYGQILHANQELVEILGSPSLEETMKINLLRFPSLVGSGISEDFLRCLNTGKSFVSERPYETKWKKKTHLRYYISPIRDENAKITGCQVIVEDFSEFKNTQEEKRLLQEQLQQAHKMEAIGRLAGGIAHDFNNLLTGIIGNINLTMMDINPMDPLYPGLEEIAKATTRAAELTRQLLAFSRKQIIQPKVVDVNASVESLSRFLHRLIKEDIDLEMSLESSLNAVRVDPGQFEQVLMNLMVNARDAMPQGGRMRVLTTNVIVDKTSSQRLSGIEPGAYVRVSVEDSGQGMDEETKARIFEPFFTTKSQDKGTGLGLATVYGIVHQHHGSIEVFSSPGGGSRFDIYLPSVSESEFTQEGLADVSDSLQNWPRGKETILLVEDEQVVRDMTKRLLRRLGYRVSVASHGKEGLRLGNLYPGRFDLLLTDVIMPGMNGKELATRLQESQSRMRVLYTSGYSEDVIAHEGVLEPGIHFLGKPYAPLDLMTKIRDVLDA